MNWKLSVICLTLSVLACGAPVLATQTPASVNSPKLINTSTQIPTEVSTVVMIVCNSGGWLHIRPEAGDLSTSNGELKEGESVTVILSTRTVTEDMALWYELTDGGWVNGRYLCEVEK